MTLEQLDVLRGYSIAATILALIAFGLSFSLIPAQATRIQRLVRSVAGLVGGLASLTVFFLFNFIAGWDEYFAAKSAVRVTTEYQGRHQASARVIRALGEMDASALGVVFGIAGVVLLVVAYANLRGVRKP